MKKKILGILIMGSKLTLYGFILQLIFYTAIFANTGKAQNIKSIKETTIIIRVKNATLREIFTEIESKTDYRFFYDEKTLEEKIRLSYNKSAPIADILLDISEKASLKFKQINSMINVTGLKRRDNSDSRIEIILQTKQISGKVIAHENDEPLPGVNIVEKGTLNGTVTDIKGTFSIEVSENATLVFSSVGYVTEEVAVGNMSTIDISMVPDIKALEEIIVVGYGTQKKETLSGSVASVKGEDINKAPVTNVSQGLAGRLPGVVAISNTGEPGYDGVTIRIRGINTFGDAAPLIVVDGVPGRSLERIDPSTIDNISVLKDASAAIYGAQAANGVILITTKRGQTGKPKVNLSYNQGFSRPTVIPEMANAAEYATLLNEIDLYSGNPERYTAEEIQKFRNGSDPWSYPNTDWFEETLKPWSPQTYGNLSVNGGSENAKYFVSLSGKSQDGFYRNSATKYNQYDLRSNLDFNFGDHINLYTNLSGRFEDRNFPVRSAENIFRMLMRSKPNMPAYWPNGLPGPDIEYGDNPVVISSSATGYNHDKRYILNSDLGLNIDIPWVEGLSLKGNASFDKTFRFQKVWQTPWYLYNWDGHTYDENGDPLLVAGKKGFSDARLNESMEDHQNILLSGLLNYERSIAGNHNVGFLVGVERITGQGDSFSAFRRYFNSSAIDQLFAGGQDEINNDGTGYENARLNYFGRVNYNFKDKYLAEFVWRYQASYIFEKSSRYGFFPGGSVGYIISEENFWKDAVPFISFLKVRASWGQTGNDRIAPFQYLATYNINNLFYINNGGNGFNQALIEGVVPNRGVTWEAATQTDIGIDLELFNGNLSLTADYFYNKRENILITKNASVPNTAGIVLPDENIGKFQNKDSIFLSHTNNALQIFLTLLV